MYRDVNGHFSAIRRALMIALFLAVASACNIGMAATSNSDVPRHHPALPEAMIAFGPASPAESSALSNALAVYQGRANAERVEPLEDFLASHPLSVWRQSLWLNLGDIYYQHGYFSKALSAWEKSWVSARGEIDPERKAIADQALGELIQMQARLGHADEVESLLQAVETRTLSGSATEAVQGAREGLWEMRNDPGIAYLCGPMALRSVVIAGGKSTTMSPLLEQARSGPRGFSLTQIGELSRRAGLPYQPAFRLKGTQIPVPSVVHWRVQHYAAITEVSGNLYRVLDPTFGREHWLTADAINAETSGYFLIADRSGPNTWRSVDAREGDRVRGMGYTSNGDPNATHDDDRKDCCGERAGGGVARGRGMPTYSVHSMLVSLNIKDTPVGYHPPKGPDVWFTLTYSQREANQPAVFPFSNLSPKWTHNWLTYVVDDPTQPGLSVSVAAAGGGTNVYSGYDAGTGNFATETKLGAVLVRTSGTPITYERRFADGSVHVYSRSDGSAFYPRRVFLTAVKDPAGNTVSLSYDGQNRLTTLTDALGQATTLSYTNASFPLQITKVTDPFGRFATIGYDGTGQLNQVTDTIGLSSSFAYGADSFVSSMTTPYGITTFSYTGTGTSRSLTATDPLNHAERVESGHQMPGIPFSESVVPTGVNTFNQYLDARNTFYWDKDAWATAPGDYTKARLTHWLHVYGNATLTSAVVESTKVPGENRLWFSYPGQVSPYHSTGTLDQPSSAARVLDDGSTQITRTEYNSLGRITKTIDGVGRETNISYYPNNIDVYQVTQKNGAGADLVKQFTYNSQHQVLTVLNAAGQTTTNTYNAAGQLTSITNALNQAVTFEYDANGYLQRVRNASNQIQASYTYDAYGRIRTTTDSEGYVLTFSYDALDRVTQIVHPSTTNNTETFQYSNLDLWMYTDRLGKTVLYTWSPVRQLTSYVYSGPAHNIIQEFSPAGRRTALYDGEGRPIRWQYDIAGRLIAEVYADNTGKFFDYDLAGRLKAITDAQGQVKNIAYTQDDQVASYSYVNAVNPTAAVSFSYDPAYPRMTSMSDGLGVTTFTYGAAGSPGAGMLLRDDGPFTSNDVVAYTYDVLGRRASRVVGATFSGGVLSGGQTETVTYDSLGRLATKTNPLGAFTFNYLGQSNHPTLRSVAASGTLKTPAVLYAYDTNANDRRVKQIRWASNPAGLPSQLLQDYNYTYDANSRPKTIEEISYATGGTVSAYKKWNLVHDQSNRIKTYAPATGSDAGTAWYEYEYDKAGNRTAASLNGTNQTLTYNSLNQVQLGTYDANGNFTDVNGPQNTPTYKWDAENRLISVKVAFNTYTYQYDGLGRRLKMVQGVSGSNTNRYLWCDDRICESRSGSTYATLDATWFDEGVRVGAVSSIYFLDRLGSIRAAQSRSTTAMGLNEFAPFGERVGGNAQGLAQGYQFANMFRDPNVSGLYWTWYRAYQPQTGRWLSRDPASVLGGVNLYNYVESSPMLATDPSGLGKMNLWPWDPSKPNNDPANAAHTAFDLLPDNPDECMVGGHGNPSYIAGFTPTALAYQIKHQDDCKDRRIILYSCNTGIRPDESPHRSYGARLAHASGQWVGAPNNFIFINLYTDNSTGEQWGDYSIGPTSDHRTYHEDTGSGAGVPDPSGSGDFVYFPPPN
jgi:RHS repeat-associated protein